MNRPFTLWLLVIVLISLSMGGFSGAIPMLMDPASGGYLDFAHLLPLLPVSNFILPGLFLLIYMSLLPLLLIYGLIAKPSWAFLDRLLNWRGHHWAWTATFLFSIGVGLWLAIEGLLVGWWPITTITAVQGGLILLITLIPNLRTFYRK
jgi:hypothetical protein